MRLTIDVTATAKGWEVRVLDPATAQPMLNPLSGEPILAVPRLLGKQNGDEAVGFPLPPADEEGGLPEGLPPDQLSEAYVNLMNQAGGSRSAERFGRYLFTTLFGQSLWSTIQAAAGAEPIDLALTWAADDLSLNRLPWELMHTGDLDESRPYKGFLAAVPDVFITRRVAGTQGAPYRVDSLTSPPKVLFVVCSALTDPIVRPGAEILGVLNRLETANRQLHSHLLVEATTTDLEEEIKRFQPSVVHIIGHGEIAENGRPVLFFRPKQGSNADDKVDAERLKLLLQPDQNLPSPQIVVLNACSTGTSEEMNVGRPMAAELVQRGVPIVVGMTGKVADQACRLFAQGFFGALLDGGEIARAAARGRRAAIAHGGYEPRDQVDWALPALYLAEAVGDARLNIDVNNFDADRLRETKEYSKRPDYPIFCGRWEFFKLHRELVTLNRHQFLAISAPRSDTTNPANPQPRFGNTRLLKELAAQSMRDGHIPILVVKDDWLKRKDWPGTFDEFLDVIIEAVNLTTQVLAKIEQHKALPTAWDWKFLPRVRESATDPSANDQLPEEFQKYGLTHDQKLAKAVMRDLLALLEVVCVQRGETVDSDIKLILIFDDVHQLVYVDSLFTLLGNFGLLDERAVAKTRGVISYFEIPVDGQGETLTSITGWANSHDVFPVPLGTLHEKIDPNDPLSNPHSFNMAALVYKQFLLNWRNEEKKKWPLAVAYRQEAEFAEFISHLSFRTKGYPSKLCEEAVSALIYYEADRLGGGLKPADDDAVLRGLDAVPSQGGS